MSTPNRRRYKYDVVIDRRESAHATLSVQGFRKNHMKLEWSNAFKLVRTKFKIATLITVAFVASGCATCERHPVACAIGGVIVAGSVIAIVENNNHRTMHDRQISPSRGPQCRNGVC